MPGADNFPFTPSPSSTRGMERISSRAGHLLPDARKSRARNPVALTQVIQYALDQGSRLNNPAGRSNAKTLWRKSSSASTLRTRTTGSRTEASVSAPAAASMTSSCPRVHGRSSPSRCAQSCAPGRGAAA